MADVGEKLGNGVFLEQIQTYVTSVVYGGRCFRLSPTENLKKPKNLKCTASDLQVGEESNYQACHFKKVDVNNDDEEVKWFTT